MKTGDRVIVKPSVAPAFGLKPGVAYLVVREYPDTPDGSPGGCLRLHDPGFADMAHR
jgi:hypothetical protein